MPAGGTLTWMSVALILISSQGLLALPASDFQSISAPKNQSNCLLILSAATIEVNTNRLNVVMDKSLDGYLALNEFLAQEIASAYESAALGSSSPEVIKYLEALREFQEQLNITVSLEVLDQVVLLESIGVEKTKAIDFAQDYLENYVVSSDGALQVYELIKEVMVNAAVTVDSLEDRMIASKERTRDAWAVLRQIAIAVDQLEFSAFPVFKPKYRALRNDIYLARSLVQLEEEQ